jgi:tetratricopeptide (TPR) repeat protein
MKKRLFLLTTLLVVLTISVLGQKAKTFYKAGLEFVDSQKWEDAVTQFSSAIALEPSNTDFYFARAKAYEKLNKNSEAFADYEKVIVFDQKDADAYVSLGRTSNKLNKFNEALVFLNHASAIARKNAQIYPEKLITLISLARYEQALKVSDTALLFRDEPMIYYYRGIINEAISNDTQARKEFDKALAKDKKLVEPRLELAKLLLRTGSTQEAMNNVNVVILANDKNTAAYIIRSEIYKKGLDYPSAINDVSKVILLEPTNPDNYLIRGLDYQQFSQHASAISDISKYISLRPDSSDAYFARAKSYEELMNYEKAMDDYNKITLLSEFDMKARKLLKEARSRLYELNREKVPPEIVIDEPIISDNTFVIKSDKKTLTISGKIKEKSKLDTLVINNQSVLVGAKKNGENVFVASVDVADSTINKITVLARDEYKNQKVVDYAIKRTEINPPKILITVPYTSDDGQVYLNSTSPNLFIEGKINDESKIKSIFIEGASANYVPGDLNPSFTATIEVNNKSKISVVAEDIYGNIQTTEWKLNREGAEISATNPMGKTYVVFIENSKYTEFASLEGPVKDINLMTSAFGKYQIHQVIQKKDLTKAQMEKFFSIELRDLIKANQVKSLVIWYAGHGKFVNDVGYWIPVDAKRDDEYSYFNLATLRGSMESYLTYLTHTLVVTDACESGPSFYQAMRSDLKNRSCDDWKSTQFKSSQVFSSAGYELAVDDSQFTRTFATALANNPKACIPIEEIVMKVSTAVGGNNQQKPKFGKITGLKDEDGTFFFIAK